MTVNILVSYCEDWETPLKTSKHHFLEGLSSKGHKILYIETPISLFKFITNPLDFLKHVSRKSLFKPVEVKKNIWVLSSVSPVPFVKNLGPIFDSELMNKLQQIFLYPFIKASMKTLDFKEFYMITYLPLMLPILTRLKPKRHLYHIVDEWSALHNLPKTVSKLIDKNFKYADITVVTSQPLFERYKSLSKEIRLLRHGTDVRLFNKVFSPGIDTAKELQSIQGVKIGYYGALHKLDFELVSDVANEMHDVTFIFIGPINGAQGLRKEVQLPSNCLMWDSWERKKLPNFLAGLDVFWMPFIINELTHYMSPIKLYEVMSSGIPIVSTDLEETRLAGGLLNKYARNKEEHLKFLEESINSDSYEDSKKRVEYTKDFDWAARLKLFSDFLLNLT